MHEGKSVVIAVRRLLIAAFISGLSTCIVNSAASQFETPPPPTLPPSDFAEADVPWLKPTSAPTVEKKSRTVLQAPLRPRPNFSAPKLPKPGLSQPGLTQPERLRPSVLQPPASAGPREGKIPVAYQQPQVPTSNELVSIMKQRLPASSETVEMKDAPEWFQTMMQKIVQDNVPDKYVEDKDWGQTEKRWNGLHVRRKGMLGLTTKRKWKEVNHGTWKRYEITQRNPTENLNMRIENVHDAGKGKVAFEVAIASKLHVFGRLAKWTKGVQILSVSADADADAVMRLWCQVGMKLDIRKFPPDVLMVPEVTKAELDVPHFRLQRVSKLGGPLVKQLGKSVHNVLLDKIDDKRDRLPEKINKEIAKNQDKMRLSLSDFAGNKWKSITGSETDTAKSGSAPVTGGPASSPSNARATKSTPASSIGNRPTASATSIENPVGTSPAAALPGQSNRKGLVSVLKSTTTPSGSASKITPTTTKPTGLELRSPARNDGTHSADPPTEQPGGAIFDLVPG